MHGGGSNIVAIPYSNMQIALSVQSWMRSSLSFVAPGPGACCRMTFPLGRWSLRTSGAGGTMAPGSACMICSEAMSEWPWASTANRVLRFSIANWSKPRKQGDPWVRCRQVGQRPQASPPRRYPRTDPHSGRDGRQRAGPRWRETALGDTPASVYAIAAHLGGRGLCRAAGGGGKGLRPQRPICLKMTKRSDVVKGFVVIPKRWMVERTFGRFKRYRRLSKDDEAHV
jgi:transposase